MVRGRLSGWAKHTLMLTVALTVAVMGGAVVTRVTAHGGDTNKIHGCVDALTGVVRIVGAVNAGKPLQYDRAGTRVVSGETAMDWPRVVTTADFTPDAKAPNADKLDGFDSTDFFGATAKAADSDKLDGLDSAAFLRATGKAADSDKLDSKDSTELLGVTAKAFDSDKLDDFDSTNFLRADAKAAASDKEGWMRDGPAGAGGGIHRPRPRTGGSAGHGSRIGAGALGQGDVGGAGITIA